MLRLDPTRMWKTLWTVVTFLFVCSVSANGPENQSREPRQSSPSRKEGPIAFVDQANGERISALVAQDIADIRRKVGVNLFRGTSLNEKRSYDGVQTDREFLDALKEFPSWHNSPFVSTTQNPRSVQVSNPTHDEIVGGLRQTGLLMDLKANALERESEYQEAHKLRRLAKRLRRIVREAELMNPNAQELPSVTR